MPQCLVDWCPEPLQISGGRVQSNGKRAGSTATYECEAGYVLIGEPVSFSLLLSIVYSLKIFFNNFYGFRLFLVD